MMWLKTWPCTWPRTRSTRAPAALVALALAVSLCVAPARAAVGDDDTSDGWKKVIAFAHCALNVFRAVTPGDWMVAALDCGRLLMEEPTYPGGGQP